MKRLSVFILFFIGQVCLCQITKIPKIIHEGEEYNIYPERQSIRFNNNLTIWRGNIIRERYKLEKHEKTDGNWIQFYKEDTTKIAKLFTLKNDTLEGKFVNFFLNGQIQLIEHYKKGYENGLSITWHKNGLLKDSIIYKHDSSHYYSQVIHKTSFHENGRIKKIELYDSNAVKNGIWTEFYDNGQLYIKQDFSNTVRTPSLLGMHYFGNIHGDYLFYYKNGQIRFKISFDNGIMIDGMFYEYYENGAMKQYGKLVNGLRDSVWTELYKNGDLKSKGNYSSGSYQACGRIPYTSYYEYKKGFWEYYYPENKLMAKGLYKNETITINNGCSGGANINCSLFDNSWIFKDTTGASLKLKQAIKKSLIKNKEYLQTRVYRPKDADN